MKDILIKWFMAINTFLIRISGGRIGSNLGTQTILLLHTLGRKSGKSYVTPIAYFQHEGYYLIVASNWGKDKQADWFLNLMDQPHTTIEVKGKTIPVEMHEALGDEYARLWKFATEKHPPYLNYKKMTSRHIPIVVLQPINQDQ
jgi:deazaflavin-dependent oxidoreductase (nitroreductase family)